jgi:hypothetical protein
LVATGYWQVVADVLITAGAFYAFVIRGFESSAPPHTPIYPLINIFWAAGTLDAPLGFLSQGGAFK